MPTTPAVSGSNSAARKKRRKEPEYAPPPQLRAYVPPVSQNGVAANRDGARILREILQNPHAETLQQCIQCSTCSGSCPSAKLMDYPPHVAINMLREGMGQELLASDSIWFCTSCYLCTARCPREIPITDLMYALKSMAVARGSTGTTPTAAMSKLMSDLASNKGRNHELALLLKFYRRTGFLKMFRMVPLGLRLLKTGRFEVFRKKMKSTDEVLAISQAVRPPRKPRV